MKYILRYMKPLAGRIMGGMSIKLFGTVMDLLIPYILAHIIDQVTPRHDVKLVLLWGGIMIVCSFLAWLGNVLANRVAAGVARVRRLIGALSRDGRGDSACAAP